MKPGSDQGFHVREGLRGNPYSSLVSTLSYGLVQNKTVPVQAHLQSKWILGSGVRLAFVAPRAVSP